MLADRDPASRLRTAGRGLRKPVVWLIGIVVTALVTGVIGQLTDSWFSSAPRAATAAGPTQVRLMQPFSASGKLLPPYKAVTTVRGGSCISSTESSDPDALRCFPADQVADPCWSFGSQAACLGSPWDTRALVIINPAIKASPKASIGPVPWALEIKDPYHSGQLLDCGFAGGTAAELVAGMRANWDCFMQGRINPRGFVGYALGTPDTGGRIWRVFYAARNKSQAVEASVVVAWR